MTLNVAITGGIGSGKSLVCNAFEELGIPVYSADNEAKILTNTDPEIRRLLIEKFGDEVYLNHELNRPFLANKIFDNPENRKYVNEVIHPAVHAHFAQWLAQQTHAPYTLHEAAIVFETGSYRQFDKIITVTAPLEIRIRRIQKRDGIDTELILKKINSQWPDENKIALSDFVIVNDEIHPIFPQILEIHKTLTQDVRI